MQKLVKKLKGLRVRSSSEHDITECESQLEQLKEISHEAVANTALKTKLSKDKELSNNEPIQTAMSKELTTNFLLPAKGASPAAKVQSRLLSSKILAAEIASALEDLRLLVLHSTDSMAGGDSEEDPGLEERPRKMKRMSIQDDDEGDIAMDVVDGDPPDLADVDEEGDDDNTGWESGTIGDDEKEPDDEWDSNSLATDDPGEFMDEDGSESEQVFPVKKGGLFSSKISKAESTFLPTLSTGFIRGDSSDWSDSEARVADVGVKKNRRGQRARRAIWEKKYGSNANHRKKEAAESNERGRKRWSQSAHGDKRSSTSKLRNEHPNRFQQTTTSGPAHMQEHNPNSNSKPLHPSWEAKKKLKEKMNVTAPPPGRKIKFS